MGAGSSTRLGGDISIQLALAMNANGKEEQCVALFKDLEEEHPVKQIRKQAENLRFIMEAPKLPVNPEEKIQMPGLDGIDSNRCEPWPSARGTACTR